MFRRNIKHILQREELTRTGPKSKSNKSFVNGFQYSKLKKRYHDAPFIIFNTRELIEFVSRSPEIILLKYLIVILRYSKVTDRGDIILDYDYLEKYMGKKKSWIIHVTRKLKREGFFLTEGKGVVSLNHDMVFAGDYKEIREKEARRLAGKYTIVPIDIFKNFVI